MSTNVPATRPPIQAGGQVAALIPQNLEEAFRVANAFAVSGLAPQSLKTPEAVLVAIMAGAELGFAPYQAMQSFAVINGRASIWGDAIPALLWARGFDIEEWFDDEDNATKAFCKVTRPSGKVIERTFSLKDAKEGLLIGKQGPWQTARKRMLQMRARAFAARDGAADVLRGMPVYEEVQDYQTIRDVTPVTSGLRARLEAGKPTPAAANVAEADFTDKEELASELDAALEGDTIPAHDTETGEIIEQELSRLTDEPEDEGFPGDRATAAPDDDFDVEGWARDLINDDGSLIKTAADVDALFTSKDATRRFKRLQAESPTVAKQLESALNGKKKALASREQG